MWSLYIYCLIHCVLWNPALTVINKGLLTYIQDTVEGATTVIAPECFDVSLGVAVLVSWWYYSVDVLGYYYRQDGLWMLYSWTSYNFQISLYGHGVLLYHHTTDWQPLLWLIIQPYSHKVHFTFSKKGSWNVDTIICTQ